MAYHANHKQCKRRNPTEMIHRYDQCKCLGEVNAPSVFLENLLDFANALAQVMVICGIHECKAKSTIDIITYAFLHYDDVALCLDKRPKKRLRKEDLFQELGKRCLMNRVEANLAYTIIKRGFRAFYYEPDTFDPLNPDSQLYPEECAYVYAAKKIAEHYARYDTLSCDEQLGYEAKIKVAFKRFWDRMQQRKCRIEMEECDCCFCGTKRRHKILGIVPVAAMKPKKDTCASRCPRKKPFVHSGRVNANCPICHRPRRFCVCDKYKFQLPFVQSIWNRDDFNAYYKHQIERFQSSGFEEDFPCHFSEESPSGSKEWKDIEEAFQEWVDTESTVYAEGPQ